MFALRCDLPVSGGLHLAADVVSGGGGPPVLLLHGGGQTRHAWGATTRALADRGWNAIAVDLRGHGDSDWAETGGYGLEAFAADVRELAGALDTAPVLVGASLGGLAALLAVAEEPAAGAAGLVLVDVAHRFEPSGGQRIVEFMSGHSGGFADPGEASEAVARYLPHRARPADESGIAANLRLRHGRWHWHWDPRILAEASSLLAPEARSALEERLSAAARRLTVPTLLVRGALSDVLTGQAAEEFTRLAPGSRVVEVAGAAHMVAGDDNASFTEMVADFVESLPGW